jgi:hypothetical protein
MAIRSERIIDRMLKENLKGWNGHAEDVGIGGIGAHAGADPRFDSVRRGQGVLDRGMHPDDGHEHWYSCIRCGVDAPH